MLVAITPVFQGYEKKIQTWVKKIVCLFSTVTFCNWERPHIKCHLGYCLKLITKSSSYFILCIRLVSYQKKEIFNEISFKLLIIFNRFWHFLLSVTGPLHKYGEWDNISFNLILFNADTFFKKFYWNYAKNDKLVITFDIIIWTLNYDKKYMYYKKILN